MGWWQDYRGRVAVLQAESKKKLAIQEALQYSDIYSYEELVKFYGKPKADEILKIVDREARKKVLQLMRRIGKDARREARKNSEFYKGNLSS